VESMKALGQIEPITVEQHEGMFEIITGHRRLFAAKQLAWKELAAIVYPEGKAEVLAMRLHENVCREDLNPAEEALFMAQARAKMGLDEAGLMALFHRSADYIGARFALLRGDPEIFKALLEGEIRLGVAHELNRIGDDGMRRYYLDCARRADPPARVVHQWVVDLAVRGSPQIPLKGAEGGTGISPVGQAAGDGSGVVDDSPAGVTVGPAAAAVSRCALCGGDRDPYNLVTVQIHRWEWEQIERQVQSALRQSGGAP
jgi:ParB/RepB/Spo0J family partition protein